MQSLQQEINQLLLKKKFTQANKLIRSNLITHPENPELIRLKGIVQLHQGKYLQAEKNFVKAINIDNNYAPAMTNLAFVRQNKGDYIQAIKWLNKSITINPNSVETHHQLGNIHNIKDEFDSAEYHFNQALKLNPNHNESKLNLAILLKNKGEIDLALEYLHESLTLNPIQPQVYWILANLKSYQFNQSEKDIVRHLLNKDINQKDKEVLLFTEAKLLEDEKKYVESFNVLIKANALKHKTVKHKATNWQSLLADIKETFTPDYVTANQNTTAQNKTPILIAGMPRSGSTLIEQMLASHSHITGASELNHLFELSEIKGTTYPNNFNRYRKQDFQLLGSKYLDLTERWSKDSAFFTDKMPHNINYAGVLLLAIPNALLIHTRRNPMDVCLSVFKQNFESGNTYSYNLTELVEYYKFQEQVAQHWKNLFPERVITVDYEQVISHTEDEIRNLLKYLGLKFEAKCLQFYDTKRMIRTASAGQVTQKIYKSATQYYKNYGDALDELSYLLAQPFGSDKKP